MMHEKLRCYRQSVELAGRVSKEAAKWPRGTGYLLDQLRRAMTSVVLNLCEGNARTSGAERRRFFEMARSSVAEVAAVVDLAKEFGFTSVETAQEFKSDLETISRMFWGLMK